MTVGPRETKKNIPDLRDIVEERGLMGRLSVDAALRRVEVYFVESLTTYGKGRNDDEETVGGAWR